MKQKPLYLNYIFIFFSILTINILIPNKARADTNLYQEISGTYLDDLTSYRPNSKFEILMFQQFEMLTHQERKFFMDKIKFHEENAVRTFKDAKEKCWWLPEIDDRKKARYCFTTFMAGIVPGHPLSVCVNMILVLLGNYGIDCLAEWEYIQNKLYWAQYHYEMKEFYEECLVKG
jgi:hypothetical protein